MTRSSFTPNINSMFPSISCSKKNNASAAFNFYKSWSRLNNPSSRVLFYPNEKSLTISLDIMILSYTKYCSLWKLSWYNENPWLLWILNVAEKALALRWTTDDLMHLLAGFINAPGRSLQVWVLEQMYCWKQQWSCSVWSIFSSKHVTIQLPLLDIEDSPTLTSPSKSETSCDIFDKFHSEGQTRNSSDRDVEQKTPNSR